MTAFDRLSRICGPQVPPELLAELAAHRAEVLAEAEAKLRSAAASWNQINCENDPDHFKVIAAHVLLIADDLRAMAATPSAAPVPDETADVETESAVEFGIRTPYGAVLTPTTVREDADARLGRVRDMYPDAVLMQRTIRYGTWTEVAS